MQNRLRRFTAVLVAALGLPGFSSATLAQVTPPKDVVWSDEFTGAALDTSKWGYQLGNGDVVNLPGWGNNELEYYTDRPQNVRLEGGNLVLTARRESLKGDKATGGSDQTFEWTSGRIRTVGKFSRTYGKIEIRAKLPSGKGIWPALWMLPEDVPDNTYGTWAANGEIDIFEGKGAQPSKLWQTLHFGGQWPNNQYNSRELEFPNAGTLDGWHVYTLEWKGGEIKWLVDGVVTSTQTAWWSSKATLPKSEADLAAWPAPFDKPFYVLLNLAVGGNFGGNPDASTPDSSAMLIDYVRWSSLPDEKRDPGVRPVMTYPWTPSTTPARAAQSSGNLVYNESFDWDASNAFVKANPQASTLGGVTRSSFWTVYQTNAGEAFTLGNDAARGNSLKVDISKPGTVNYAVQVRQDGLNVEQNKRYQLDFDAWASVPRTLMVKVGGGDKRGYAAYSGEKIIALSTTAGEHHSFTFDMTANTDTTTRLEFNLGSAGAGQVWIDNAVLKQVGDAPKVAVRPPLPDGNLIYNGGFGQEDPKVPGIAALANTSYWKTYFEGGHTLTPTLENGELRIAVDKLNPANNWFVQLNQPGIPLEAGKSYTLSLRAHSSSARTVAVVIGEEGGSYARYLDKTAALDMAPQTFTYTFTAPVTNPVSILQILGAVGKAGDSYALFFDDFKLVQNAP